MANQFLTKKVAKFTLDLTSNYTASVTNAGGKFTGTVGSGNVNETADTLKIENHIFQTGDLVGCVTAAGGTVMTAPATGTAYYIINVDKDHVALATSAANAAAGTKTAITAGAGAGFQYLIKDAFGAIGSGVIIPNGAIVTGVFYNV